MSEIDEIQKELTKLNNQLTQLGNQGRIIAQEILKKQGILEYLQGKKKEKETDNCKKIDQCYKIMALKDKEWAGDWQFADYVKQTCEVCKEYDGS